MPSDGDQAKNPQTGEVLEWQGGSEGGWGAPNIPFAKLSAPTQSVVSGMTPEQKTGVEGFMAARQRAGSPVSAVANDDLWGAANAASGNFVNSIPLIGPTLKEGAQRVGAHILAAQSGTPYDETLAGVKAMGEQKDTEHPVAKTVGGIGGVATSLAPLGATGVGSRLLGMEGPILARPVLAGGFGAGLGAADAAARGDDVAKGAAIGGVTGAAGPIIGGIINHAVVQPIARAIGERLPQTAGPLAGFDPIALKLARNAAKADGLTDAQIDAKVAALGPQGFLLDYGQNLKALAGGATANSGEALTKISGALGGRVSAARPTIDSALTEAMGAPINVPQQTRYLRQIRADASDPLYEQFRQMHIPMTPELESVWGALQSTGALKEASTLLAAERKPGLDQFFTPGAANSTSQAVRFNEAPTPEVWDYAKRGLDEIINRHKPWGSDPSPNKVRVYSSLKSDLINALDNHPNQQIGQVYQKARQAYAEPSGIEGAMNDGRNWRDIHRDELPYYIQNYSGPERQAFLQGVRSDLDDMLTETARGGTKTRDFFLAPANQDKLETLVGSDKAKSLVQEMERQKAFADTKSGVVDNSKTAARVNVTGDIKNSVSNWAEDMLHRLGYSPHVTPLSYVPGMGALKQSVGDESAGRLSNVLSSAGNLLTTGNPQAAETLRALMQYSHPGETAGPAVSDIVNVLARSSNQPVQEGIKMKQGLGR